MKKLYTILIAMMILTSSLCATKASDSQAQNSLIWQDEKYTKKEKKAYLKDKNYGKAGSWEYAKKYCKDLTLDGHKDWHLPTIKQLRYLHQHKNKLKNVPSSFYWSSTTRASYTSYAWAVNFDYGYDYDYVKIVSNYIRCVRLADN